MFNKYFFHFFLLHLVCLNTVFSQKNQFVQFNRSNGFQNNYVYDCAQDSLGHFWFATGLGLIKLDNNKPELIPTDDHQKENLLYALDIGDNSIWMGGKNGYIANFTSQKTHRIKSPFEQRIVKVKALDDGRAFFFSEDEGFYLYDNKTKTGKLYTKEQLGIDKIINAKLINGLWYISTYKELAIFKFQNNTFKKLNSFRQLKKLNDFIFLDKQTLLFGSENKGLGIAKIVGSELKSVDYTINERLGLNASIKDIFKADDGKIWISTFEQGTIEVSLTKTYQVDRFNSYNTKNGFGTDFVSKIYQDYEGSIWACSYGDGVMFKPRDYINLLSFDFKDESVNSTKSYKKGTLFCSQNHLFYTSNERELDTLYETSSKKDIIHDIEIISNDSILYCIDNQGLFLFRPSTGKSKKINYSNNALAINILDILVSSKRDIWLGTYDGTYQISFNGEIKHHYSTQNGLRHNVTYCIAEKPNGEILLGCKSNRIAVVSQNTIKEIKLNGIFPDMRIKQFLVESNENIWVATLGSGIFHIQGDMISNYHKRHGLEDNFIFNLSKLQDGNILLVHERSIGKFDPQKHTTEKFGNKYGIASKFIENSISTTNEHIFWGASGGIISFSPEKYFSKSIAPKVGFSRLYINDSVVNTLTNQNIELPYADYKIMLDYKGISFINSSNINFSYFLEGFDDEWHEGNQPDLAIYKNIGPGEYRFKIKACLNNNCQEKTAEFTIYIDKPLWEKPWFVILMAFVAASVLILAFYFQALSNKRKKLVLEYSIEMKTQELKKKNAHIISSITYAKHIQDAVLPVFSLMDNDYFDHFEIVMPKDIVGGDFIWSERIGQRLYVAVCDCTGHGVPGGFMTILSANLLKSVIVEKKINQPKQILNQLNIDMLNQMGYSDGIEIKDGMDMSLVVFDFEKQSICYSGANRPFFVQLKGMELEYVKGTRKSIGDHYRTVEFHTNQYAFEDIEALYFFTDGWVDQFGGGTQSKYGRNRLKDMLSSINKEPIEKQQSTLQTDMVDWKSSYESQLDDITLVGFIKKPTA